MNSKRSTPKSDAKMRWSARLVRAGMVGLVGIFGGAGLAVGCLDRPVTPLSPRTTNQFVDQIRQTSIDKIDLLFMVDNLSSMADKQAIMAKAVPQLVARLITPLCVNAAGAQAGNSTAKGGCPAGYAPEFNPLPDIHIGIVTSSLGSHGGEGQCTGATDDDHAHMLATVRPAVTPALDQWNGKGFLVWDPLAAQPGKARHNPPGESDPAKFIASFTRQVTATDENGCGYESSLEAWYRFLITPDPIESVKVEGGSAAPSVGVSKPQGNDKTILDQRAAFLRPDSLVAIIMLTDENDCSIVDDGLGWMVASTCIVGPDGQCVKDQGGNDLEFGLGTSSRATSQCLTNPNDKCCEWCAAGPAAGCPAHGEDSECKKGPLGVALDKPNLRCYKEKKRFGIDLLYPIQRYIDGLTKDTVPDRTGKQSPNPLFAATADKPPRPKELVFFAGILGVPWQDIATAESLPPGAVLRYMTAGQMREAKPNRWDVILGHPQGTAPNGAPVEPLDPLMLEQPEPRSGLSPIVNQPLAPTTSTNPTANAANGHEWKANEPEYDDLQYACIFRLDPEKPCAANGKPCDCGAGLDRNKPLCNPPGGGAAGSTQYFAKGYPGTRILEVLKGVRDQAIVASICPKFPLSTEKDPFKYGYNPAVNAIVDRLKEQLKSKCLPRELKTGADGRVPCAVVEAAKPKAGESCSCAPARGRNDPTQLIADAVRKHLEEGGICGGESGSKCSDYCLCDLNQFADADFDTCVANQNPATPGYCYIDDKTPGVKANVLDECKPTERHKLRFAFSSPEDEIPARGALTYIACMGGSVSIQDVDAGP